MARRTGGIQATFSNIRDRIDESVAVQTKAVVRDIASYAVSISPVDTGAYVLSFSVLPAGSGGGRMRTSHNKPRRQDDGAKKQEALGQINSDIEAIDFTVVERFTLRNRAEHARDVEDKHGYAVFAKTVAYGRSGG